MKHSDAGHIWVDLTGGPSSVALTITDDGKGFDVNGPPNAGLGLISMRERVESVGGVLEIHATPASGTRLTGHRTDSSVGVGTRRDSVGMTTTLTLAVNRSGLSLTSRLRVLVVEDHEPFRRVICELLQQRADLLIVGEAADGLDAIRQAEALRPDVVMLDIGLPMLSGIEVAGRIRAMVPDAKLMFVTNESSLEVVEQAFRRGAHGYVYKPRVQRDVLPVLEAIIRGGRFVSGGLERIAQGDSLASHRHEVLFCSSDAVLIGAFSRFIAGELHEGNAVIVVVTAAHERESPIAVWRRRTWTSPWRSDSSAISP